MKSIGDRQGDQSSLLQLIEGDQFEIEGDQFSLLQSIEGDQFDLVAFPVNESVLYLLPPAATHCGPSGRPVPCCTRPQTRTHTWPHSRLEHPQDESCTFLTGHGHQSHRTSAPDGMALATLPHLASTLSGSNTKGWSKHSSIWLINWRTSLLLWCFSDTLGGSEIPKYRMIRYD